MNKKIIALIIFVVLSGFSLRLAQAFNYSLMVPLPQNCTPSNTCPDNAAVASDIAAYIVRIYQFAVSIAGILAVGMIVVGAIYFSVSADSPDKKSEGKNMIISAIWGLVLLLGSYIILNTINSKLVTLAEPNLPMATTTPYQITSANAVALTCPNPTAGACYFDPTTSSTCSYGANIICEAIDGVTPPCQKRQCLSPTATFFPANNPYPVKNTACGLQLGAGLGACFLDSSTLQAFGTFYNRLKTDPLFGGGANLNSTAGWRITEAFPPMADHADECHYNGTCFDFAMQPPPSNSGTPPPNSTWDNFCRQILAVDNYASVSFNTVIIEGPPKASWPDALNYCVNTIPAGNPGHIIGTQIINTGLTTGFHLHIGDPKT